MIKQNMKKKTLYSLSLEISPETCVDSHTLHDMTKIDFMNHKLIHYLSEDQSLRVRDGYPTLRRFAHKNLYKDYVSLLTYRYIRSSSKRYDALKRLYEAATYAKNNAHLRLRELMGGIDL